MLRSSYCADFSVKKTSTHRRHGLRRISTEVLVDPSCWCALATDGEVAQGIITVSTVLYVEWGRLGEIGDLYVLPEHRRHGLARRLVERAKIWCRSQGCSAVSVTITPAGERRHRLSQFYARLGFEQSGSTNASAALQI